MSQRVDDLARALGETTSRIQVLLRRDMARKGVSLAQARTLSTLSREGPRALSELAALEQVSQPAMSYLVGRLELSGHVMRSGDAGDGRVVIVSITAPGRLALHRLVEHRADLLAQHLSRVPSHDIAKLEAALPVLDELILALEGRTQVAASR